MRKIHDLLGKLICQLKLEAPDDIRNLLNRIESIPYRRRQVERDAMLKLRSWNEESPSCKIKSRNNKKLELHILICCCSFFTTTNEIKKKYKLVK